MSSLTGLSPNNPLKYLGPGVALPIIVTVPREPTGADIKQPTTGKYYSFGTFWLVGKNPTTGSYGDMWYLSRIAGNVAFWILLAAGGSDEGPVLTITGDTGGPISPDVDGNINLIGDLGVVVDGSGDTLTAAIENWVSPSTNNWIPVVQGSSAAGTCTYTFRNGVYSQIGAMIYFMLDISWTGHTGTGSLQISGFPEIFAISSRNYPFAAMIQDVTLPANSIEVFLNGVNGASLTNVVTAIDATTVSPVLMAGAANGTISCIGYYFTG